MKEKEKEKILKALANRRRLAIIDLLRKGNEKSVGEIADNIKLSFRATSKHLSVLMNVDILEKEQRSLQMFYSLNKNAPSMVKQLLRILFIV
ncbi:MAG: Transcriptional regulator, ArsR family protein [Parcubacteria group bacterium GW2011_GWF2_44_8b]|nr:MAG: Transcriptional regulator, ArsR family protein [Parcubacteria group bacterium GW2011_GWC1_43_30]KKT79761.1 MAG: Transcriptional regulator, ArsR family protein [Parcubacteria group bacterium GW2011_GWF2_44_8b]